jgi:hypothetical protein
MLGTVDALRLGAVQKQLNGGEYGVDERSDV